MVCVGIVLSFHVVIPYTVPQYVFSGFIMFVSAEVLEGKRLIHVTLKHKLGYVLTRTRFRDQNFHESLAFLKVKRKKLSLFLI